MKRRRRPLGLEKKPLTLAVYDTLMPRDQARMRAIWKKRLRKFVKGVDLTRAFDARGQRYAELNENGYVVIREPRRTSIRKPLKLVPVKSARRGITVRPQNKTRTSPLALVNRRFAPKESEITDSLLRKVRRPRKAHRKNR